MLISTLQKCDRVSWSIINGCLSGPSKCSIVLLSSREVFVFWRSLHILRHTSLLVKRHSICPYLLFMVNQWAENSSQESVFVVACHGNGPEFWMPYWTWSQYTAQYVKHSFCWWMGDLVSWTGKIYFTKDRRCWTSNKIPPGAGVGGGSYLTYILEAFILCPLNIIWTETGLNFPNFFIGNSVSLPSLQRLAMELVTCVHNMLRCLDFFLLMFPNRIDWILFKKSVF